METVSIYVSNRIERDAKLLASVGLFAWERAVRDAGRALPSSGTSGAAVGRAMRNAARQLGNSSSFSEMQATREEEEAAQREEWKQRQSVDSLYEEFNTPMDEIKSVMQSIRDILSGDTTSSSAGGPRGLRSVAPAGQAKNAERQRRAFRKRKATTLKEEKEILNIGRATGGVVDAAFEIKREFQVESSKPGYRSEGARKAIAAGAAQTAKVLEAAKKDGWSKALFGSSTTKKESIKQMAAAEIELDVETIKAEAEAQAVAQLLLEKDRIFDRLELCIENPAETWLTPDVLKGTDVEINESALQEVVMAMIVARDDLEAGDEVAAQSEPREESTKPAADGRSPLFLDLEVTPVFIGDTVTLIGLSNAEFNGLVATVLQPDSSGGDGRYAVRIVEEGQSMTGELSVMPFNMIRVDKMEEKDDPPFFIESIDEPKVATKSPVSSTAGGPQVADILERMRQVKGSVDMITALAGTCAGDMAGEKLRTTLYGIDELEDNRPSLLSLNEIEASITAAVEESISAAAEAARIAAAEAEEAARIAAAEAAAEAAKAEAARSSVNDWKDSERVVVAEVIAEPVDRNPAVDVSSRRSPNVISTDFDKQSHETNVAEVVSDSDVRTATVEVISDEDFENAMFSSTKDATTVSEVESSEEEKPDIVVNLLLRGLDVVLFVGEKLFTVSYDGFAVVLSVSRKPLINLLLWLQVAIPKTISVVSTATKRISEVNRSGMGHRGWKTIKNTEKGNKRY